MGRPVGDGEDRELLGAGSGSQRGEVYPGGGGAEGEGQAAIKRLEGRLEKVQRELGELKQLLLGLQHE